MFVPILRNNASKTKLKKKRIRTCTKCQSLKIWWISNVRKRAWKKITLYTEITEAWKFRWPQNENIEFAILRSSILIHQYVRCVIFLILTDSLSNSFELTQIVSNLSFIFPYTSLSTVYVNSDCRALNVSSIFFSYVIYHNFNSSLIGFCDKTLNLSAKILEFHLHKKIHCTHLLGNPRRFATTTPP